MNPLGQDIVFPGETCQHIEGACHGGAAFAYLQDFPTGDVPTGDGLNNIIEGGPGPDGPALEILKEMATDTVEKRYVNALIQQLAKGVFKTCNLDENALFPRPTSYDEEIPSFDDVYQRIKRMAEFDGNSDCNPIELVIDGIATNFEWQLSKNNMNRRLTLTVKPGVSDSLIQRTEESVFDHESS